VIAQVGNITENLVADRADLDGNAPFFHFLHQQGVFEEGQAIWSRSISSVIS
jgi:hypothetical protein